MCGCVLRVHGAVHGGCVVAELGERTCLRSCEMCATDLCTHVSLHVVLCLCTRVLHFRAGQIKGLSTLLHLAAYHGHSACCRVLRERGADVTLKNKVRACVRALF